MLPENKPSKFPVPKDLLVPKRLNELIDYEWGGIAIQNTSQGLRHSLWECSYLKDTGSIVVRRLDQDNKTVILSGLYGVTRLGLAFDFNMRPTIVFVHNGLAKLYWFDTAQGSAVTTDFVGMSNPCISLDDTRLHQSSKADIILAYQKGSNVFIRQQRDRFQKEILFYSGYNRGRLFQIGMNTGNRFEFRFK